MSVAVEFAILNIHSHVKQGTIKEKCLARKVKGGEVCDVFYL